MQVNQWPHRLAARTPGFHPGNRSSILREVTIVRYTTLKEHACRVLFLLAIFASTNNIEAGEVP